MKIFLISTLSFFIITFCNAQNTFEATYISTGIETAYGITSCKNTDIIMVGSTESVGQRDALIIRTSAKGKLKWTSKVGVNNNEVFFDVLEINPNRYIAAGQTTNGPNGNDDAFIYCFDSSGVQIWQKVIGGTANEAANSIAKGPNNSIIISLQCNGAPGGGAGLQFMVATFDILGNILRQRIYGNDYTIGHCISVDTLKSEIIMVGGGTLNHTGNNSDAYFQKSNIAGLATNPIFNQSSSELLVFYNVKKLSNGDYIACGQKADASFTKRNILISRFTNTGTLQWMREYPIQNKSLVAYKGAVLKNGTYTIVAKEFDNNSTDGLILNINANTGDINWKRAFEKANKETISFAITATADGGMAIAGNTNAYNTAQNSDIFILKLDNMGMVVNNCDLTEISINTNAINSTPDNSIMNQKDGNFASQVFLALPTSVSIKDSILCKILKANFSSLRRTLCEGDTTSFNNLSQNSDPLTSFKWTFEGGTPNTSTLANPTNIKYSKAGTYAVKLVITDASGLKDSVSVLDYITVIAKSKPSVTINIDTVCGSIKASNQVSANDFVWYFGDNNTSKTLNPSHNYAMSGTFIVTLVNNPYTPCADSTSKTVIISKNRFASIASTSPKCTSDAIQLQASGGNSYSWQPTLGLSNANIANPLCFASSTTTYTCTVTSNGGCTDTAQRTLIVKNYTSFTAGVDFSVCQGNTSTKLSASSDADSYIWMPSNAVSNPNIFNPEFINASSATLILKVSMNGCNYTDSIVVTVNDTTIDDFSFTQKPCESVVNFIINRLTNDIVNYIIDYGDGITENVTNAQNINHSYVDTGKYTVILSASSGNNCAMPFSDIIYIAPGSANLDIQVPNVFTPNNDGKNDEFKIINENDNCYPKHLLIFNRWGEKIYDSGYSRLMSWDGKSNDLNVPDGVYLFILEGEGFKKTGTVTVFR